jgi:hypothetical protein
LVIWAYVNRLLQQQRSKLFEALQLANEMIVVYADIQGDSHLNESVFLIGYFRETATFAATLMVLRFGRHIDGQRIMVLEILPVDFLTDTRFLVRL